ncbi:MULTISPECIES: Mov34/MPN/PAD-1 family protein [Cohnella]|jgi:proteasome lid subunit RPN8/RPN11|uniref:Mov34/MPN/PAD-1 family protein n=1 Tax=Cohnella TaxID=329857 RepID=UPI00037F4942|nr:MULTISPECIES: M67 family metallopeptidase [Cohnella]REK63138.1 MAG: hypothetical protein C6P35_14965 [Cohnella sp.]
MCDIRYGFLNEATRFALVRDCLARAPYEACGVMLGDFAPGRVVASGYALVRNAAGSPERAFRFDPDDWAKTYGQTQKNQRNIVGLFHSHPQGAPSPSLADRLGWDGWGSYWIVALQGGQASLHVYVRDQAGRLRPVELVVVP